MTDTAIDPDFYYVISNMSRGPGLLLTVTQGGGTPNVNLAFRATQLGQLSYQFWAIRHPDGGYVNCYTLTNMSTGNGLRLDVPQTGPNPGMARMAAIGIYSQSQSWWFNEIQSEFTPQGYLSMSTLDLFGSFLDVSTAGGVPNQAAMKVRVPYCLSQAWLLTKTAVRI